MLGKRRERPDDNMGGANKRQKTTEEEGTKASEWDNIAAPKEDGIEKGWGADEAKDDTKPNEKEEESGWE